MAGERGNVAAALAQRRQRDRRRADPLGEAGVEILGQRAAAGRDHPDVDRMAAVEADRADLAGREHAVEQLLRFGRQAPKSRRARSVPPSAWTSLPVLAAKAPGKGALLMAEQLAVDDVGGDRLAVEREQRALGAQARGVDGAGEGFLARPGSPMMQDRQAVARRLGGDRERGAEFGRGADQLLERERRRELFGDRRKLAGGAAAVGIGGERFEQPLGRDRPDQEIGCAGAHRLDRDGDAVAVRQHDDRQVRALFAQRGDQLRAAFAVPARRAAPPGPRGRAGPEARRRAISSSAAPTTLQPARAAIAEISRRSSASASSSNRERVGSSRISGLSRASLSREG